ADENDRQNRRERQQSLMRPLADAPDDGRALRAHGHEQMGADEDNEPENEDSKTHGGSVRRTECSRGDCRSAGKRCRSRSPSGGQPSLARRRRKVSTKSSRMRNASSAKAARDKWK